MRKMNQQVLSLLRSGGPFTGQMKAQSRVTVEPAFWLNQSSGVVGNFPANKLPARWWQRADNSQVEAEIPNIKSVQITRDLTQQAATVQIQIYNTVIPAGGSPQSIPTQLGDPGFFSWSYGSTLSAQQRWHQTPNAWSNVLRENALIRVYQGYGGYNTDGTRMTIPQAVQAGYLILKGVFLLDDPAIESNGITTLNGRDMAKLLIDQQTVPPLVPPAKYPLNYWGPGQTGTATIPAAPGYGLTTYVSEWFTQRIVYDSDSGNNRKGSLLALDGNNNTAWVSNSGGSKTGYVWIEVDVQGMISGFYINPWFGNYTCFVSIMAGGRWLGGQISAPRTYTVVPGDCLWDIAERFFGNPLKWVDIYNMNRGVIGPNPNLIYAGQVLVLGGQSITVPYATGGGATTYTVVPGDTLWAIAGRLLGNPLDWPTIYNQNVGVIGPNPNLIFAGQVLTIGSVAGAGAGIPPTGGYAIPLETARWYTLPHALNAQKVRFSFTNLYPWAGLWVAGIRELKVGQVGKVPVLGKTVQDMAVTPTGKGYWIFGSDGNVFSYGDAGKYGNLAGRALPGAIVGGAGTLSGKGYWLMGSNGSIYTFGDAHNYGGTTTSALTGPLVALRRTSTGLGYWMVSADATVIVKGDAVFYGTTVTAGAKIVDMAPKPDNSGYWLLDQSGKVYACGSVFHYGDGASGNKWVGIESTATGNGYWIVTNTGVVSAFGDAVNRGGTQNVKLVGPITGIKRHPSGVGYWMCATDGGIFSFNVPFHGSLPGKFTYSLPVDYSDYADIIKDLALWSGFWLYPPGGTVNTSSPPSVYGTVETTGAYDTLGPLGIQFFDKRPVIDVMTDIAKMVGYLVRVGDTGEFHFEAPNYWAIGNFYSEDNSPTSFIPAIDERINLSDYVMTQSDQNLRSPIIVTVADPYEQGGPISGTNVTTFIPPYANLLKGQIKSAMFAVPLQVAAKDQRYFAELIALRIWFQTRSGAITAWCDPTIEVDDQVRIYERNSGETNVHYVQAITSSHDLDSGKFEMQLTTYWLGGHDVGWAVTSNLASFFGNTNSYPVTTLTPGYSPTSTQITAPSIGQQLPQPVIFVQSTAGMPPSGPAYVDSDGGAQSITYTGLTATSVTGCRGGQGKLLSGGALATWSHNANGNALPTFNQTFPISDQLALFLGASGAKTTRVFATGGALA